jgi:hypothetical protein
MSHKAQLNGNIYKAQLTCTPGTSNQQPGRTNTSKIATSVRAIFWPRHNNVQRIQAHVNQNLAVQKVPNVMCCNFKA